MTTKPSVPTIRAKPYSYQPSKAELEEPIILRKADGSQPTFEEVTPRRHQPCPRHQRPRRLTGRFGTFIYNPPQDTPHYFADTREIYGTVQVATGSERCAGAATWQPLAVSVQSRKVGELSDEPGPPWTAAAQPAVQSAALAESVVDQYENDGARTPQPVTVQTTTAVPKDYRDGRPISKLAFALPPMCREVRIRPAQVSPHSGAAIRNVPANRPAVRGGAPCASAFCAAVSRRPGAGQ